MNYHKIINEAEEAIEQWTKIKDFDNYSVSVTGKVRKDKTNEIMKPYLDTRGYYFVSLSSNRTHKTKWVHRLVGETFLLNLENKKCVDHIDNNPLNNNLNNLRFATHQENSFNTKLSSNNTSGVKGVCWNKEAKRWRAKINLNKEIHLGYFYKLEDAKKAVEQKRLELHGAFANNGY